MAENTAIQWTDHTFNPWIGCDKVSPGCANCYAAVSPAAKFKGIEWGKGKPRYRTSLGNWAKPLAWNARGAKTGIRQRVFCSSLADWLDDEVPLSWLIDLLALVERTPHIDWLLLTKRPENWHSRLQEIVDNACSHPDAIMWPEFMARDWLLGTAPANVWLGVTVEDVQRRDERLHHMLEIPARVRFLSMEPLLEAVDLTRVPVAARPDCVCACGSESIVRSVLGNDNDLVCVECGAAEPAYNEGVHWIIVGGESGHKARPFLVEWARALKRQCVDAGVPIFIKQLGAKPIGEFANGVKIYQVHRPPRSFRQLVHQSQFLPSRKAVSGVYCQVQIAVRPLQASSQRAEQNG